MSRGSRFPTLLLVLGAILASGPAGAEDRPGAQSTEAKAAGQWIDPPAKVDTPAMNAAPAKPSATPAKLDEPRVSALSGARTARRAAKLRRERIRTVASRSRPIRQVRVEVSRRAESQPSRRVAARPVPPLRTVVGRARSLGPVYGYIAPDAPAYAYYDRRRIGTVGSRPGDLGLSPQDGAAYRTVGMRGDGPLIMRWYRPGVPTGFVIDRSSPFDRFDTE